MRIAFVASESVPFVKVGGLADVAHALAKELASRSSPPLTISLFLPKYDCINQAAIKLNDSPICFDDGYGFLCTVWTGTIDKIEIKFFESSHPRKWFDRGRVYGEIDDVERFIYFCQIVYRYLQKDPWDILHLHDWPTAFLSVLIHSATLLSSKPKVLLTIHNLEQQGWISPSLFPTTPLLEPRAYEELQDRDWYNMLKGGIGLADHLTTVSPTYRQEILTEAGGKGLHIALQKRSDQLVGILNGIESELWNPARDPLIEYHYTQTNAREQKRRNQAVLLQKLGLKPAESNPLMIAVTRLVFQKGLDQLIQAIEQTLARGGLFILLGVAPESNVEARFCDLLRIHHASGKLYIHFSFDETLSHQAFAAADMIVIPSLFEPCGLTQLVGFRYGAIPIARKTGGLADTVFDIDTDLHLPLEARTGFTYQFPDESGIGWATKRAIDLFYNDKARFDTLMSSNMQKDFSWKKPADEFLQIYSKLIS